MIQNKNEFGPDYASVEDDTFQIKYQGENKLITNFNIENAPDFTGDFPVKK